jgi:hypothetical protein
MLYTNLLHTDGKNLLLLINVCLVCGDVAWTGRLNSGHCMNCDAHRTENHLFANGKQAAVTVETLAANTQ